MSRGIKNAIRYLLMVSLTCSQSITAYGQINGELSEIALNMEQSIINEAEFNIANQVLTINEVPSLAAFYIDNENEAYWVSARVLVEELLGAFVSLEDEGQTLRIKRGDVVVQITAHKKIAKVNDKAYELVHEAYINEGSFMVSTKDLEALFDLEFQQGDRADTLIIKGEDRRPNTPPVAEFYFMKKNYVEGQEVVAVNISKDKEQDAIARSKWCVGTENVQTADELSKIFKTPKAGNYVIGLQVQDARGLWSEWTYETIHIADNKRPKVEEILSDKMSYAPGEELELKYTYSNESWEAITNEKWMYRKSTEDEKLAVLGKPKALFTEGDYIVSLQIDDASGKRSEKVETTIHIEGDKVRNELEYHFNESQIGDRIDNYDAYNFRQYEDAPIKETSLMAGTLLMSDSPEVVKDFGILYEDTIKGKGRILLHHLNGIAAELANGKKQKLILVAANDSEKPITFTLKNEAIKGPATDITRVGQKVVYDYMTGVKERTLTLAPGERQFIYSQNWAANGCISGLLDVETKDEIRFMVAAVTEDISEEAVDNLNRLPADGTHISGTFDTIGIKHELELDPNMPTKLMLGDNGSDEWVKGYDSRTETEVSNKGNFGVTYYVTVTAEEDMGIFLNSRGSGIQGAIKWQGEGVYNIPSQGILSQTTTKAVLLGTLKKGETKTFEYILPNGSSAPVLIGFVPKKYW